MNRRGEEVITVRSIEAGQKGTAGGGGGRGVLGGQRGIEAGRAKRLEVVKGVLGDVRWVSVGVQWVPGLFTRVLVKSEG